VTAKDGLVTRRRSELHEQDLLEFKKRKRQFTGEIHPDATHRTTTVYLHIVNAALRKDIFTPQVTIRNGTIYWMDIHPAYYQSQYKVDPYK